MPQDATCPACAARFPVTEARGPFAVECPVCGAVMTAEFGPPSTPPEPGQPPAVLAVRPGAPPSPLPAPAARPRPDRDETPRRGPRGSGAAVVVTGALGVALVVGGLNLTAWALFTQVDVGTTTRPAPRPAGTAARTPVAPAAVPPAPPPAPVPPAGAAPNPAPKPPDPPARAEWPARPEPLPITPAPVTAETVYKLPEPVQTVRVGGGGRFLILHFPKARKLGVFDASAAKVVREIAVQEDDPLFAAGMSKLLVLLPGSRVVQRFDLLTGARERVGTLDLPAGPVEAFCMGHASAGPLLVSVRDCGAGLYDADTFQELPLPADPLALTWYAGRPAPRMTGGRFWAGATGRLFGSSTFTATRAYVLGDRLTWADGPRGGWYVVPGPDARHLYTGGFGVQSERFGPASNVPDVPHFERGKMTQMFLPAHHGPFYLRAVAYDDGIERDVLTAPGLGRDPLNPPGAVAVFAHGSKEPIARYERTAVSRFEPGKTWADPVWAGVLALGIENSVHLIPKAKLLVVVPEKRDELRLYPADLDAALEKAGRDYVLVTSDPPARFERGAAFAYQVEARARRGPLTFRLESGPPGMTVGPAGLVRWAVPGDFADGRAEVIVSARDATGQEALHAFTLTAGR